MQTIRVKCPTCNTVVERKIKVGEIITICHIKCNECCCNSGTMCNECCCNSGTMCDECTD
jgi:hypothetical protein